VVVAADVTGSDLGNTLCLDSRLGAAETYLAEDVPPGAAANLQVDTSRLAIGGFSFGGTCALQSALRRPAVYPTFLDISGQAEPTLGKPPPSGPSRRRSVGTRRPSVGSTSSTSCALRSRGPQCGPVHGDDRGQERHGHRAVGEDGQRWIEEGRADTGWACLSGLEVGLA